MKQNHPAVVCLLCIVSILYKTQQSALPRIHFCALSRDILLLHPDHLSIYIVYAKIFYIICLYILFLGRYIVPKQIIHKKYSQFHKKLHNVHTNVFFSIEFYLGKSCRSTNFIYWNEISFTNCRVL